ncbi:DEP domain-containing protein 1B [Alosa sapidissima]|uniref:DEP domain-containing protein 1B n=1 Tax=Alosa sapidissima TaxID=34773 RepID=UPI001C08185B|nr:DEP domain-containing protein 1B [Alosa sapidissima]XP_041916402.1 DEP domain-containing protein 1B [Alosa sapidissima]XP_041916403.1 DEP domain-containing protein 1B [Alosa sapidissima]XP_041916404.1 DEP domain-containing protein 1B [Alosa sapidissima]
MEGKMIGPGPYRATKLWNETIRLFRGGMPLRRHWLHFRSYDNSFTGSEAIDWLHELLKRNHNFGPEVTRYQTLQLLKKFMKNHVIEDVKGRFGKEDFEDNGHLYRFPPESPLKPLPQKPRQTDSSTLPRLPRWDDYEEVSSQGNLPLKPLVLNSETWNKRHSIAIGEVHECKLIRRKEITAKHLDQIWRAMTLAELQRGLGLQSLEGVLDSKHVNPKHIIHNVYCVNKQGIVVLKNKTDDLPHWVLSAMKCLANWPNGCDDKQPMYPGFERDVFRTVAEYFQRLKEPLLTFQLYEVFVNILGLLQKQQVASEAVQVCCVLLPPANRRKLQLLLRLMARVCHNPTLPPLNDAIATRTLMAQTFSRCILSSPDEVDLDELLATKLVTFMMDNQEVALQVPAGLQKSVEEHVSQLRRVQIKYAGADTDTSVLSPREPPTFCRQISREEFEEQRVSASQDAMVELLEGIIQDKNMSIKDKKKKMKQFQRSYPEIYTRRFPTAESEAAVFPEKPSKLKPQMMFRTLKKPFQQPFQRSWSFRA